MNAKSLKGINNMTSTSFRTQTINLKISLMPSSLVDVEEAMAKQLNSLLLKYNNSARGVILAYDDVVIKNNGDGKVLFENPQIHYEVSAKILAFAPERDVLLRGKVNEHFPSHLGLLVYNFFNAMIPADILVKNGFKFYDNVWHDEISSVPLDEVEFKVVKIHECAGVISIEGIEPHFSKFSSR